MHVFLDYLSPEWKNNYLVRADMSKASEPQERRNRTSQKKIGQEDFRSYERPLGDCEKLSFGVALPKVEARGTPSLHV